MICYRLAARAVTNTVCLWQNSVVWLRRVEYSKTKWCFDFPLLLLLSSSFYVFEYKRYKRIYFGIVSRYGNRRHFQLETLHGELKQSSRKWVFIISLIDGFRTKSFAYLLSRFLFLFIYSFGSILSSFDFFFEIKTCQLLCFTYRPEVIVQPKTRSKYSNLNEA